MRSLDNFQWTDEQVELLRSLMAQGKFFSEIGEALGVSRNAAIGKARRLGIPSPNPPRHPNPNREKRERIVRVKRFKEARLSKEPQEPKLLKYSRPEAEHPDYMETVLFDNLQRRHCRYPFDLEGMQVYCGNPVHKDTSWCDHHFRIVRRDPPKRVAK